VQGWRGLFKKRRLGVYILKGGLTREELKKVEENFLTLVILAY